MHTSLETAPEIDEQTHEAGSHDLIAEQLEKAETPEQRAKILAPCIGDVISAGYRNFLEPTGNIVHSHVQDILKKTGVIES